MDRIFANAITFFRKRAGLTHAKTAALSGLTQSCISRLEDGSRWPREDTVLRLCRAFGIPAPDFFMYVAVAFMKLAGKAWIGFEDEE